MKRFPHSSRIKKRGIISGVILSISMLTMSSSAAQGGISDVTTIKKWITKGALIVDVRTPGEFAVGNYRGSINIPLNEVENNLNQFGNKKRLIVVYCRSGNRSGIAKEILEKHGFINVINGGGLTGMP